MEDQVEKIRPLLEGCRRFDRKSQELLYREFYGYGMSICLRYTDTRDEAAEILNDGFMKIFTNIMKFDLSKPFKPWLRRIMINTSINHYRQKQRLIHAEEMDGLKEDADSDQILSSINYREIIELLKKLPPSYRTVFNLHVIEGYKHEEIATLLGITTGASKSALFKAKEHLKKILNDFFESSYVEK